MKKILYSISIATVLSAAAGIALSNESDAGRAMEQGERGWALGASPAEPGDEVRAEGEARDEQDERWLRRYDNDADRGLGRYRDHDKDKDKDKDADYGRRFEERSSSYPYRGRDGSVPVGLSDDPAVVAGLRMPGAIVDRLLAMRLDVAPVFRQSYQEECGACHFAYQPGLLPAGSWVRVMSGLADHFGEDAALDDEERRKLSQYLVLNAAELSPFRRSRAITRSLARGEAPLRVTETRYFRRKHHELSRRQVEGNPEVGSFGRCEACHRNAETGSYNEHEVVIPGYGRWDD